MFLKCDPYRVWCSILYSKLVNCILLRSLFVFVKGSGTCGRGERNVKIWIDFRKSPRFSLSSPLSQEREVKSPCFYYVWWALVDDIVNSLLFCKIPTFCLFQRSYSNLRIDNSMNICNHSCKVSKVNFI